MVVIDGVVASVSVTYMLDRLKMDGKLVGLYILHLVIVACTDYNLAVRLMLLFCTVNKHIDNIFVSAFR